MNKITNKINAKYGDKIDIKPSKYALKFNVFFQNMGEENN